MLDILGTGNKAGSLSDRWSRADEDAFVAGLNEDGSGIPGAGTPSAEKEPFEKGNESGTITTGAVNGAYNDRNDPEGKEREAHAERYYTSVYNSKKEYIATSVSQNTGIDSEYISKMYDRLFVNEYDLDKGHTRFDPDYYIAESVQGLRDGKSIQEHDLILVYHEAKEYDLMNNEGLSYEEVHEIANQFFNYKEKLDEWIDENES